MTRRYIVGYDGSGPSRRALAWATARASAAGSPLLLVAAWHGPESGCGETEPAAPGTTRPAGASARAHDLVDTALETARLHHPAMQFSGTVIQGNAVAAILDATGPSDVLIIGTHKTGHLHGRALGTTGLAIATGASCTVVVVPDADLRFRRGVVAGIDLSPDTGTVSDAAAAEAEVRCDDLLLLTACVDESIASGPLRTVRDTVRREHPALRVRSRLTRRPIAPALLDAALGEAMLVIGAPHPYDRPLGYFSGILHDVLFNLTAPVLIARSQRTHDGHPSGTTAAESMETMA